MGLFGKLFSEKKPNSNATQAANRYIDAFSRRVPIDEMNKLSEDLISLASLYWQQNDFESYKILLNAAEETSYFYNGSNYPNKLVEDLIRESH